FGASGSAQKKIVLLFVGTVIFGHLVPIDHIEKSVDIIGPPVLIVQVIGVLPNVKPQNGMAITATSRHQGIVLVRGGTDFHFPALVDAQPGPTGTKTGCGGRRKLFPKALKGSKGVIDGIGQLPTGFSASIGGQGLPKE